MKAKEYMLKKSEKKRLVGFRVEEDECIWMKAGIVNFRLCDNAFDCYNCPFDAGMQRAMSPKDHAEIELKEPEGTLLRQGKHAVDRSGEPKTIKPHGTGIRTTGGHRRPAY